MFQRMHEIPADCLDVWKDKKNDCELFHWKGSARIGYLDFRLSYICFFTSDSFGSIRLCTSEQTEVTCFSVIYLFIYH